MKKIVAPSKLNQELIEEFENFYINSGYKPYTVRKFTYEIWHFFKYLAGRHIRSIHSITIPIIEDYKDFLKKQKPPKTSRYYGKNKTLSPKTISEKIQIIKNFFVFTKSKYNIGLSPESLRIPKAKTKRMDCFSKEEISYILNTIDRMNDYPINKARLKLFIAMGFVTGMRLSELLQITIPDILHGSATIIGKWDKLRPVYFNQTIMDLALEYRKIRKQTLPRTWQIAKVLGKKEYAIISHNPSNFWHPCVKSTICRAITQLNEVLGREKHLSAHTLRHSCATHLLQAGANLMEVKEMLWHESIRTTQIYLHLNNQEIKNRHELVFWDLVFA